MANSLERCSTSQFNKRMEPHAEAIYRQLFPGCQINNLRQNGAGVHVLDKEFGIDKLVVLPSGQWITLQEKYRQYVYFRNYRINPECPDFTQEHKNGYGTRYEREGEWFKLAAQLYFYGWANEQETGFHAWVMLDIAVYKLLVQQSGGLHRIGKWKHNQAHGSASFYCIPIVRLEPAQLAWSGEPVFDLRRLPT